MLGDRGRRRFSRAVRTGVCMKSLDTIEVDISVELGATVMPIHHLLRMGRGAVIELDTTEQDPLRVYANTTLVAHGEIRIEDGHLSVAVTEKIFKRGAA